MGFRHFSEDEIDDLFSATIEADLNHADGLRALSAGIAPGFRGKLPSSGTADIVLGETLDKLNRTEKLVGGEVPMQLWLRRAARLSAGQEPNAVFQNALGRISAAIEGEPELEVAASSLPECRDEVQERAVLVDETIPFGFLRRGHHAGLAVARVEVPRVDDGTPRQVGGSPDLSRGTGWLATPDLLVTNQHVIKARPDREQPSATDLAAQAARTVARFDYHRQGADGLPIEVEKLEIADIAADYAVLRLKQTPPDPAEGGTRAPLALAREPLMLAADSGRRIPVNIIQHPFGDPKKVACRSNLVSMGGAKDLRYFTDTREGSSGSPVMNDDWVVVALHRASRNVENVVFQGFRTPWVNVGTQISAVLGHIEANRPDLFREIVEAQQAIRAVGW